MSQLSIEFDSILLIFAVIPACILNEINPSNKQTIAGEQFEGNRIRL